MKIKYGDVTDSILKFLDENSDDFLASESFVMTNGRWEIHLDFNGENFSEGAMHIRHFVQHKKNLIGNLITSHKPSEIITTAEKIANYFEHRQFTVSIGAKSYFDTILLRLRIFIFGIFGV
jgi:hypothetical protein